MPSRIRRSAAALVCIVVVAGLMPVAVAAAQPSFSISNPWVDGRLEAALARNAGKLPVEFEDRLDQALVDGKVRVLVTLTDRDETTESFVKANTSAVKWYGDDPRFYGVVDRQQMAALLDSRVVKNLSPDYLIKPMLASSVVDINARSRSGGSTGVWWFDPADGPMGALKSSVPGLTADQATGKGVTVAVTDSGIDRTNRDFGGWDCQAGPYTPCNSRIVKSVSMDHIVGSGFDFGDSMPTTEAASGHGTHVAGIIGGNAYYQRDGNAPVQGDIDQYGGDGWNFGVAPQANLISTKNGDLIWAGLSSFGLQWQLDNADEYDIRVSSNSWGCLTGCAYDPNSLTAQIVRDMYNAGIVVVFAAGNGGGTQSGTAFAGDAQSPYVLAVANYDDATRRLSSTSSRGSDNSLPSPAAWTPESEPVAGERRPDVAAPGQNIWSAGSLTGGAASTVPRQSANDVTGGSNLCCTREYRVMSGTSMATPHVAGTAALLFGACPAATPLDVMRAVISSADAGKIKKTTGDANAEPFEVGYGALEVRRAMDWLLNQPACGGAGGTGGTDPSPTATPTPTPTPSPTSTPTQDPEPATSRRFYFHSGSTSNQVDEAALDAATFDTELPTFTDPAIATDVPVVGKGTASANPVDPTWHGTAADAIETLTVDFWQDTTDMPYTSIDYDVVVWRGETAYALPTFTAPVSADDLVTRVQHTFTGLDIPAGSEPLTIDIKPKFNNQQAGSIIYFDSVDYPSGFSIGTGGGSSSPTPTPSPTSDPTTPPPPPGSRGTYPLTPNDEYFGPGRDFAGATDVVRFDTQWGPQRIKAPEAWQEVQATGYGVDVAVLDSGVDLGHPDLDCPGKLNVVPNSDLVGNDGDPQDENGHGTHVAGIIGACTNNETGIAGIAPDARIMPIRVLDAAGNGTVEQITSGIRRATAAGAEVINMSLSQREISSLDLLDNSDFDAAIQEAADAGVVIVAAAGNDGFTICNYPALAEEVVCVGATDNRDNKSWYSNFADKMRGGPAVVAPGGLGFIDCGLDSEEILSLYDRSADAAENDCDGRLGYANLNGTSMAAPHVSGVAALVYDRLGGVRSAENRQAVIDALTTGVEDLGAPGYDPVYGYGRVDALKAVRGVEAVPPPPTAQNTTLTLTGDSATAGQYSDQATFEAKLVDESGTPIEGAEVAFDLIGLEPGPSFTAITGADGTATKVLDLTNEPGTYQVTARYLGKPDAFNPSATTGTFVLEKEDAAATLVARGFGTGRTLMVTLADRDTPGAGLAGRTVEIIGDGNALGAATTDDSGTAVVQVPAAYQKGAHRFEAAFAGDDLFLGARDVAQTGEGTTAVTFAPDSAPAGQYSDAARIAGRVLDEAGDPVAQSTVRLELTGPGGSREWTAQTGDDGRFTRALSLDVLPGAYTLTARYLGKTGLYSGSAVSGGLSVTVEDTKTVLALGGTGSKKTLTATLTDLDSGAAVAGRTVQFLSDGIVFATATTGGNGTATVEIPKKDSSGHHNYEARFPSDACYKASSDLRQT